VICVGIDWAEASHSVCVMDEQGVILAQREIPDNLEGARAAQEMFSEHAAGVGDVVIGIETDHGLLVGTLRAAGYQIYAINPLAVSRYRDRYTTSGAKSDPGDAMLLADLVRTDRHHHRVLAGDSDEVGALEILARAHQGLIWSRQRQANQLRSALRHYYPAALAAFGNDLDHREALAVLRRAPTPERGRRLSRLKLIGILSQAGRQRNHERRADQIYAALRTEHLAAPPVVAAAYGASVHALAGVLIELNRQIEELEAALTEQFRAHPDAEIVESLPGLGVVLGARVLAEFGDDPTRYADSKARKCYAGTAPITRASGRHKIVRRRIAGNTHLHDACFQWASCAKNTSPGAKYLYYQHRAAGNSYPQAVRAVANRLVGILHGCLRTRTRYDEHTAWPDVKLLDTETELVQSQNEHRKNGRKSTHAQPLNRLRLTS
jgi:Transposase/Transposase IS116/IS110/IS902 family